MFETRMVEHRRYNNGNKFCLISIVIALSSLLGLEVMFPPHDPRDAGSNPVEVVEFLRTEKFREQVLREGLQAV
jgi:hypothetical protein